MGHGVVGIQGEGELESFDGSVGIADAVGLVAGEGEGMVVQELFANLRDGVRGQVDELRDVGGAVRGHEVGEPNRRAGFAPFVDA
jgi:hypothetical protein